MGKFDELTIGEVKEIKSLFTSGCVSPATEDVGIQIVVLDRSFVYIGNVSLDKEWVYIAKAKNIRRWGTTKGLSQLVNGPLADTILDDVGNVRAPRRALIALIAVEDSKWTTRL